MRNIGLLLIFLTLTAATANAEVIHHTVKKGETLQIISMQYFGTTRKWIKIWEQNKAQMEWPNSLEPGMTISFEGPANAPEAKTAETAAPVVKPEPVKEEAVAPPAAPITAPVAPPAPSDAPQAAAQFNVPPPPAKPAPEKKPSTPPAIHMVEIQPVVVTHKQDRAIASEPQAPAEEPSPIRSIRVNFRHAIRAMGDDTAALNVDHMVPSDVEKVSIGKPVFANDGGLFSAVRVSPEELAHAAQNERAAILSEGFQAEQDALTKNADKAYKKIVAQTAKSAVESAKKIQIAPPPTVKTEEPQVAQRKIASATETKHATKYKSPKNEHVGEKFSATEPDPVPAKPKISNEIIQKLGSQNLFGPDL